MAKMSVLKSVVLAISVLLPALASAQPMSCEQLLEADASNDYLIARFDDQSGRKLEGFVNLWDEGDYGDEITRYSRVFESENAAFFYNEACDICGTIIRCDKKSQTLSTAYSGHAGECSDLSKILAKETDLGRVSFDSCK